MRRVFHSICSLSLFVFWCSLLCLLALTGCNDDIFIKPEPVIDDMVLDGNGGKATFRIRKKELKGIRIDCPYFASYSNVFFYGKDGEILYDPIVVDEVAKVTFSTPCCAVDFLVDGDDVTVVALDNTLSFNISLWVILDYGATTSDFEITVTPGLPMILDNIGYGVTPIQTGREYRAGARVTLNNNTDRVQILTLQPFADSRATVKYESSDNWETGATGYVPVLYYSAGEWLWPPEPNAQIEIGATTEYTPYGIDLDTAVSIEVPPHAKMTAEVTVAYAKCVTNFSCELIMPNSGIPYIIWGTCQIRQPIDYEITKVCENI